MDHIHEDPEALSRLQEQIYRENILRARSMTAEQRLGEAFELTNCVFDHMLAGAMWQTKVTDKEAGWEEVRRRLDRLRKMHDFNRFTTVPPKHDR